MKVLLAVHYFFPDHFYGTETYTLELARGLRQRGHQVEILSAMSPGEEGSQQELLFTYEYDGFTVHCVDFNHAPHTTFRQLYNRPEMFSFYRKLLVGIAPDVLHVTHLMNHTAVILDVAKHCSVPVMATLTDFFGICFNSRLSDFNEELCAGPNFSGSRCLRCYMEAIGVEESARNFIMVQSWAKSKKFRQLFSFCLAWLAKFPVTWNLGSLQHVQSLVERANFLRNSYKVYRKLVAPTDFLHDAYVFNKFPQEKMVKLNFGINWGVVADFREVRRYDSSRSLRFGYIGQLAEHKGVDMLFCLLNKNHLQDI